jgi:hypothetical protein
MVKATERPVEGELGPYIIRVVSHNKPGPKSEISILVYELEQDPEFLTINNLDAELSRDKVKLQSLIEDNLGLYVYHASLKLAYLAIYGLKPEPKLP